MEIAIFGRNPDRMAKRHQENRFKVHIVLAMETLVAGVV